jgi:hypothetical protein
MPGVIAASAMAPNHGAVIGLDRGARRQRHAARRHLEHDAAGMEVRDQSGVARLVADMRLDLGEVARIRHNG